MSCVLDKDLLLFRDVISDPGVIRDLPPAPGVYWLLALDEAALADDVFLPVAKERGNGRTDPYGILYIGMARGRKTGLRHRANRRRHTADRGRRQAGDVVGSARRGPRRRCWPMTAGQAGAAPQCRRFRSMVNGVLEVELPPLRAGGDVGAERPAHDLRQRFIPRA
jgi:hypothetical protein